MMLDISKINLLEYLPEIPISLPRKQGSRSKADKRHYCQVLSSFDIETTRIPSIDNSVMYIWQWHFHNIQSLKFPESIVTVYGRTWGEYFQACTLIKTWLNEKDLYMVRLVHNLSYEFQFISAFYDYKADEVFCMDKRKVARADSFDCIEDRCTFIHSNMSLSKYAETWGAEHHKLSGIEFDYNKPRYPWTPMTEQELAYCENDVLSVCEAYINEMNHYNDNLYSIPLLQRDM